MGASNVVSAYVTYAGKVPPLSMVLLAYMALVSRDQDDAPWYGEGHAALAEAALGRPGPAGQADIRAVERAMAPLRAAGAITTERAASGKRDAHRTVRYKLHLDTPASPEIRGAKTGHRPTESVAIVPRNPVQRPTESGSTSHGNRVTEEYEEYEELQEEEVVVLRTDVTARGRAIRKPGFGSPLGDLSDLVSGPNCPHGIRRGDHPDRPRCAICRRRRRRIA